jgi:aarF domain-containing kinase
LDFDKTFSSFDPIPIGSASIGQVHRAVLREGNIPVVVKVRYPNVERLLRGDVRTIKAFAKVAQPVHVPGLEEIEHQFQTEFDYRQEAEQLEIVRANLEKAGLAGPDKSAIVPRPYLQYCTERVLVMDELNGNKLAVEVKKDVERHAARAGQSFEEFVEERKAEARKHEEKGESVQGASAKEFDMLITMNNAQRQSRNLWNRVYNLSVGWLPGNEWRSYQDKSGLPLNHAKLVDDLIYIHGHEVLVDGFFNNDPHPGRCCLRCIVLWCVVCVVVCVVCVVLCCVVLCRFAFALLVLLLSDETCIQPFSPFVCVCSIDR